MMVEPGDKEMSAGSPGLVCPETHLPLEPASAELLESLAERQRRGRPGAQGFGA